MRTIDQQLVEGIFEKITAETAAMPVIDGEEMSFDSIFFNVESYANSILIIAS